MVPIERQPESRDIRARIKRAVTDWAVSPEQSREILDALRREAYPLHRHARLRAGALSATACRLACGSPVAATAAAAITELFMAAGFILDDVMDDDAPPGTSLGAHTALGLATLLIAQTALDEASADLPAETRMRLSSESRRLVLSACEAQQQELRIIAARGDIATMTTDAAMALTQAKAGPLGELCCVIGLGLADGLTLPVATDLRECYRHHFTYIQVVDDLADAAASAKGSTSDIEARRPTLPAVFFAKALAKLGVSTEAGGPLGTSKMVSLGPERRPVEDELKSTGTVLFTQLAAETERNQAQEIARRIGREWGGAADLLSSIGAIPREGGGSQNHTDPTQVGSARQD